MITEQLVYSLNKSHQNTGTENACSLNVPFLMLLEIKMDAPQINKQKQELFASSA